MKVARAGLTMVTFLSWMVNARTSSFIGRTLAGNTIGLKLRSVGSNSMFPLVLCLRQGWYVVYQHVRKVHLFMLRGIWGLAVFGLSDFFFVFCARWRYWVWFFTSWGVQDLGLVGVPFFGRAPWAQAGWGITFMITGKKAWQFIIQL